jgi:hypothetical protein
LYALTSDAGKQLEVSTVDTGSDFTVDKDLYLDAGNWKVQGFDRLSPTASGPISDPCPWAVAVMPKQAPSS